MAEPRPYKIGKPEPLRIHKNFVIEALQRHPEDLALVFPDGQFASAAEAIEALRRHPAEWIIDGVLSIENNENLYSDFQG